LVRWLAEPKRLSHDQARVLREAVRRCEPVAITTLTLLEIALLFGRGSTRSAVSLADLLEEISSDPAIQLLPLTVEIAAELAGLGKSLRDPVDRAIVATARVCRLRLLTSDQVIIDSGLVTVVE
jgi:PIN domain nuclease of toxin-antitoxin system